MNRFSKISNRDKAVLSGLYLSKFDKSALAEFGFTGFTHACNIIGCSLGIKPLSIRNYRDEFDPVFGNRRGYHKREMPIYCRSILLQANDLNFDEFTKLVRRFIMPDDVFGAPSIRSSAEKIESAASNRMITGRAAEEYFKIKHAEIDAFKGFNLQDATSFGCGFDFKLQAGDQSFFVEVKGMNNKTGSVLMTEKEYDIASLERGRFCLFIVRNFIKRPEHVFYMDPLHCGLAFKRQTRTVVQTSYSTPIK